MNNRIVVDTNVLVSALLSPNGNPAHVLDLIIAGGRSLYYDADIIFEYERVLTDNKFPFKPEVVHNLLSVVMEIGHSVVALTSTTKFTDESDRKFFDVAVAANAIIVTGNKKHYPDAKFIMNPSEYLNLV